MSYKENTFKEIFKDSKWAQIMRNKMINNIIKCQE